MKAKACQRYALPKELRIQSQVGSGCYDREWVGENAGIYKSNQNKNAQRVEND